MGWPVGGGVNQTYAGNSAPQQITLGATQSSMMPDHWLHPASAFNGTRQTACAPDLDPQRQLSLNQQLIRVLGEEGDLRDTVGEVGFKTTPNESYGRHCTRFTAECREDLQLTDEEDDDGEEPTPVIRQNYFKEIYESERGKTLKLYGAELDDAATCTDRTDREQQAENDEIEFIKEQRFCSKSNASRLRKQKLEQREEEQPEEEQEEAQGHFDGPEERPQSEPAAPEEPVEQEDAVPEKPAADQKVSEGVCWPKEHAAEQRVPAASEGNHKQAFKI